MRNSRHLYDMILAGGWPLVKAAYRLGRRPVAGPLLRPLFSPRIHQAVILPVMEPVQTGQQTPLPYALLERLVAQASARVIMDQCVCRVKENCQAHPHNLGCLFLGEGARQIHPSLGRLADEQTVRSHIQRATAEGLVPMITHTVVDAVALGIPFRRMLTVCFCCDCCCAIRQGLRTGPPAFWELVQRLPGLAVTVSDACEMCEQCVGVCPVGAISMDHDRAEIAEHCKGCGLCVQACPNGAIALQQSGGAEAQAALLASITRRTRI